MWRESLIFERDDSWMRFGLPAKKVQRSDLGSSWFVEDNSTVLFFPRRTTELELKIDRLFLKCLYLKDKRCTS